MISILDEIANLRPNYPSLIEPPYFDEKRATPTQKRLRDEWRRYAGKTFKVLWLGGKGSGKSYMASLLIAEFVTRNPGVICALIANTRTQISDTPQPYVVDRLKMIGVPVEMRTEVTIEGKRYRNALVVKVGEELYSYILIRSFENIEMIEGTELDSVWIDEVQDTSDTGASVVLSRLRGQRAKSPDTPSRFLIATGLIGYNYDWHWTNRKSSIFDLVLRSATDENLSNLPPDYLNMLKSIYTAEEIEMFVYGRPTKRVEYRAVFNFDPDRHILKEREYADDPHNVVVSVDFNPAPMCATVYSFQNGRWVCVDEIELWGATTYDLCEALNLRGYGGVLIGDATANRRGTRNELTDYDIIEETCPTFTVIRGLMTGRKGRRITYFNPPLRDTARAANYLLDNNMIVFNPSRLESGGAPASIMATVWDVSGNAIDKRADRTKDPRAARTHFADTFRYFSYYVRNIRDASENYFIYEDDPEWSSPLDKAFRWV